MKGFRGDVWDGDDMAGVAEGEIGRVCVSAGEDT